MALRDALYIARMTGYFDGLIEEVNRQIDIFASPIAAHRPDAAWGILPLGLDPEIAIEIIAGFDVEDPPDDLYRLRLDALRDQLAQLEHRRLLFLASEQTKDPLHVN